MDKHELAQRLMAAFLEELHEHVGAMNRDLMALEKNPPPEQRQALLKELFRAAHTMKGAANANSIRPIELFCHHLEDILIAVRDGKREQPGCEYPTHSMPPERDPRLAPPIATHPVSVPLGGVTGEASRAPRGRRCKLFNRRRHARRPGRQEGAAVFQ